MFCPQCGTTQGDDLKFCKSCGANLSAVRQAVTTHETPEKSYWGKAWGTNWLHFQEELEKLKQIRELNRSPEEKRYNEIKAGVITSCVGLGLMIFLYVFMQGIIMSGKVPSDTAQILSHVWIAGVIPLFVGAGLLINGVFVSQKLVELKKQKVQEKDTARRLAPVTDSNDELLPSADWYESDSPKPSVTEHTTRQLENSKQIK
ncbi:MAG TPA: DUF6249 domain-containing protein [Blastocatellia bacterium]|nr:DUF6249 domain-containing protein [Blastocatellia bacterium]